jgi:hypothetical protein
MYNNTSHPIKYLIPILTLGLYCNLYVHSTILITFSIHAEKFPPIYSVYKVVLIVFFLQKHAFITGENPFRKIRSKRKDSIYNDI